MVHKLFLAGLGFFCISAAHSAVTDAVSFQFHSVPVSELAQVVLSDVLQRGYILADGVSDRKLTVQLRDIKHSELKTVFEDILSSAGLRMRSVGSVVVVEPEPDKTDTFTYEPKHRSVSLLGEMVIAAFPDARLGVQRRVPNAPAGSTPITGNSGSAANFDRQDDHMLIIRAPFDQMARISDFINDFDTPVPQLLISGASYEVSSSKNEGRAVDLVASLLSDKLGISVLSGAGVLSSTFSSLSFANSSISAVLAALDEDSRFKSLSKPYLRVRSGSRASFNVGSDVPVLGSITTDRGLATQSIDYRSSGVLLDVEPLVLADSIELKIRQEFSSFEKTDTGLSSTPTLNKRFIQTTLDVSPGEILVIGGLQDSSTSHSTSRLPFLGLPIGRSDSNREIETILVLQVQRL